MKVVFLKGESQYDVLSYFLKDLAEGFAARGWEAVIVDLVGAQNDGTVARLEREKPDLVFSFNIAGDFCDGRGRPIAAITGAPHVVQLVDYPLHSLERLNLTTPSTGLLMVDPSHVTAVRTLFSPERFAYLGFSPHGGMAAPHPLPASADAFAAERPIPILFAGSYYRPQMPIWEKGEVPPMLQNFFRQAVDRALAVEWVAPQDVFDAVLVEAGLDPASRDEDLLELRRLSGFVHTHVRQERRLRFFQAAARVGLPLTVAGAGYEADLAQYPNITLLGPKPVEEVLALMRRSQMVANISANFGQGSHERPLTAMRAGAVAASDHTTYFAETFTGSEIALFRWQHLEEDLTRIAALARQPAALFAMARAGQAAAAAQGWANRIDAIIAAGRAVAAKLNLPSRL